MSIFIHKLQLHMLHMLQLLLGQGRSDLLAFLLFAISDQLINKIQVLRSLADKIFSWTLTVQLAAAEIGN